MLGPPINSATAVTLCDSAFSKYTNTVFYGLHSLCSASYWMQLSSHTHTFHACTVVYHWYHSHHTAPCHSMNQASCSTKHIGANCPELVRTVQDYPCPERKLLLWFHHDTTVSLLTSICDSTLLGSWASDAIGASPQQFTSLLLLLLLLTFQ